MSKRQKAKLKISRRLGAALWGHDDDPFLTKNYPPGQHGPLGKRKVSDYGNQLRAKQQLKKYYGDITEKQFRKIYAEAVRRRGDTSENLIGLLESRLDAIVYRSNFVPSIFAARQLVNHRHVKVNGNVVNIASYRTKPGDVIELSDNAKTFAIVIESLQKQSRHTPEYLEVDTKRASAKYSRMPVLSDVPYPVQMEPNLVIEFYSR